MDCMMDCMNSCSTSCSTLKRCLSSNTIRFMLLSFFVVITVIGLSYPMGYVWKLVMQTDNTSSLFVFWCTGFIALVWLFAVVVLFGIVVFLIYTSIETCIKEWKKAKVNNESEQLLE